MEKIKQPSDNKKKNYNRYLFEKSTCRYINGEINK